MLAEIGATGQARLEDECVELVGDPGAVATAALYLRRAGVDVRPDGRAVRVPRIRAGRPELGEAAAFVAGAWAAVEAIKTSVGAGRPAVAPDFELTGPKESV